MSTVKKSATPDISLPNQLGSDFEETRDILTYKPSIEHEEPPQEDELADDRTKPVDPNAIEAVRKRVLSAIEAYKTIEKLAENIQAKVDRRVEAGGGMDMQLDALKDAHVIAAVKRCHPECKDPSKITYEMYKNCLAKMSAQSQQSQPQADTAGVNYDPYKTDFGGLKSRPGDNRPEISSPANVVKPVDLKIFQAAAVVALFALLFPFVKAEDKKEVAEHLATVPHKPI